MSNNFRAILTFVIVFLEKWYWQEYAEEGKLHRYFLLTVTAARWVTMYIGFCTQLPEDMKAYVVPDEVTPSSTSITLKRIRNKLHHTVPVVIWCDTPGTYNLIPKPVCRQWTMCR